MSDKSSFINTFKEKNYSLLVVKNNEIIKKSFAKGIRELLSLYEKQSKLLKNALIGDKIVGAAAAAIYKVSDIKYCYAKIISQQAVKTFKQNNISFDFHTKVEHIKNRAKDGLCPIEKLALAANNESHAIKEIKNFINN